jgi:putative FmdB family regulatory protein
VPIYEYQCAKCGTVTDIRHGFKETTSDSCPKCGGDLKRLFNPAGIVFKGSGFYVTDSRKPAETKSESAPAAPATPAAPASTGTPKSDAAA